MEQYLSLDSHHNLSVAYSAFNTLTHRVRTVCNNQQLLQKEDGHIRKALHRCTYSTWALTRLQTNISYRYGVN